MPFYRYSATDKLGAQTMGTIEAATPDDALMELLKNGFTVSQLMKAADQSQALQPQSQRIQEPPRPVTTQQPRPTPRPQPAPSPKRAPINVVRTKVATDHDRMILFSQFAKQMKAGMGPAAALDDLRYRVAKHMAPSVQDASKAATNGQAISDSFERYPDLYPDNVVATIRAGEQGGFLEEASELIADQAQNAHSFSRMFWWVRPMIVNAIISIPIAFLFLQGLVQMWNIVEQQAENASTGSAIAAMLRGVLTELMWPVGPLTILLWLGAYWLYRWMRTEKMRRKRHELALAWPAIGAHTRHECLAVFSWIMSKLSKSGATPKQAWELAAESVPNLAVRDKLQRIGNGLTGNEKLSDALFREQLFPQEYAPILATAEYTGDMPAAFEQLAKISKSEFEAAHTDARIKSGGWGRVGCMVVSGILLILLCWVMYRELLPAIAGSLDQ